MNGAFPLAALLLAGCAASLPVPEPHTGLPEGPIVAFGDSYTQGWGADPQAAYPTLMAAALGLPVLNLGVGGETAAEALPRVDDVLANEPRLVIVAFGTNEAFRDQPVSLCTAALDAMLARLVAAGVPVVLVGVRFGGYQGNLDAELQRLAEKHGTGLVLDTLGGILDEPTLTSDGGFHPNAAGYAIMESRIRPEVQRVLGLPS